jgi:hypothetical protein
VAEAVFVYTTSFPEVMGSVQLQALIPARHLGAKALYFGPGDSPDRFLHAHKPDVLIFTKLFHADALLLAEAAKAKGVKIIGVFCDLHLDDQVGQRNRRLSKIADKILVPTKFLRDLVAKGLNREVEVLEEPIRYPRQDIRFSPGSTLKLLWCGHANNHDTLEAGIRNLTSYTKRPLGLMITSNQGLNMEALVAAGNRKISLSYAPWSPEMQFNLTRMCDFIFIPSFDTDEKKSKGHDRLVEAINGGRIAIAHPLPQYQELAEYCYCGADYAAGIDQALSDPAGVLQKLGKGQAYIDKRFSPEVIAGKWQEHIDQLVRGRGTGA